MASFGYWGAVALAIGAGVVGAVSAGCGGPSFAAAGNDNDASSSETGGGASSGGTSGGGASGGADSSTSDGSSSGVTSSDGAPGSSGAGTTDGAASGDASASDSSSGDGAIGMTDAPAPPCPDVAGAYAITLTQATGCGSLNVTATECVRSNGGCSFEFRSSATSGGAGAIDGTFTLNSSGTFEGAALSEGSASRTGCTGSWSMSTSTMTVDCGGTGTVQSCVATLLRTSTTSTSCN